MSQSYVAVRRRAAIRLPAVAGAAYVAAWVTGLAVWPSNVAYSWLPLLLFWLCAVGVVLGHEAHA
jgi:hypothetical protein